jgi:hypothetical protein
MKLNRLPLLTKLNRLPLLTKLNRLPLLTKLNRSPLLKKVGYRPTDYWSPVADRAAARAVTRARRMWRALMIGSAAASSASSAGRKA